MIHFECSSFKRTLKKTLKEEVQEKEKMNEDPTPVVLKLTKKKYKHFLKKIQNNLCFDFNRNTKTNTID